MAVSKKTKHQAKKEINFKARNYSKFGEDRRFECDDISNIKTELNKHTFAPVEGYQPLYKNLYRKDYRIED